MTRQLVVVSVIFGAAFTVGVSLALGSLLLRRLRLAFHRLEGLLFAFLAGSACLSLATFLLCVIQQARLAVFLAGGAGVVAWAIWEARLDPPAPALPGLPRLWLVIFAIGFGAFFVCYFSNALAPEISPDGSSYHLGNVARCWRHQGFDWSYHSIYSSLPQGMEMLFLVAFCFGRHSSAAMVHMAFQAALPLLIVCYGCRFGFPRIGAFAALLVYACPVAGIAGISAYNDLTVATFLFAGFYLIQVKYEYKICNLMILIGLLAGFAYAVKYTAGLALPVAVGFSKGKRLLPLSLGAAIMAGPWILRNWLWLGNPVAPFLNLWFPNAYWSAAAEHQYLAGLGQYPTFKSYFDFVMQLSVLGGLVPGMIGPAFLLLPLCLLALRHPHGRRALAAGVVYAIPALFNTEIRFLIPALPFFALALGLAMENSWGALPAVALLQAVLCWPAVMTAYCDPNAWRVRGFPWRAALRLDPEAQYISSRVGDYALKDAVEQAVPAKGRIFSFAGRAAAYLDRDIIVGYESTQGMVAAQLLEKAAAAGTGLRAATVSLRRMGFGFILVNDSDAVAESMNHYFTSWGLTKVAEANGTALYRLD